MIQSKNPRITSISILKDEQASGNGRLAINAAGEQNPDFTFYGKTESARTKWNQFVTNGNFDGTTGWSVTFGRLTASNNVATLVSNGSSTETYAQVSMPFEVGHKYYVHAEAKAFSTNQNVVGVYFGTGANSIVFKSASSDWMSYSGIKECTATTVRLLRIMIQSSDSTKENQFRNIMCIDLTAIFGSGNEPTTTAEFEAYCATYGINLNAYHPMMADGYNGYVHNNDSVWTDSKYTKWNQIYDGSTKSLHANNPSMQSVALMPNLYATKVVLNKDGTSDNSMGNNVTYLRKAMMPDFDLSHKYYVKAIAIENPSNLTLHLGTSTGYGDSAIKQFAPTETGIVFTYVYPYNPNGLSTYITIQMNVVDLTAIFGQGNEPTTVAQFEEYCEAHGINLAEYQPYEADGYRGGRISLADYDLREINGIRDEYNASTGTITRRIGKVVLDGTQSISVTSYQRCIVAGIDNVKRASKNTIGNILSVLKPYYRGSIETQNFSVSVGAPDEPSIPFMLRLSTEYDTADKCNEYFRKNPTQIFYELETPVTESVQKQTMPAVPGNNVYTQIEGAVADTPASVKYKGADEITDGIASGTLDIDEMLCNDPLTFGNMCASKFECQLYKDIDVAGKEIEIRQTIDGASIPVFHGYVDSAKKDYSESYRQIVAYDGAEKLRDTDISAFWESFWDTNTTATLKVLISALCASQGYVIDDKRPLGFHDIAITKPFDLSGAKMTFGDCLRYLCEVCLYHPHISRDGKKIVLNSLNPAGKTINNVIGLYDRASSDFEDYVTKPIERVLFYEDGQTRADVGAGNTLVIDNNPILYAFTDAQLATLGNAMLAELKDYGFRPARVEMVISAPDLQLADTIYTEYGRTFILNNRMHGIQLFDQSIRADADEEQAAPIQYNAEVRRKLSQADFTGAAIADRINNAPETVVIEADHINLNGAITANGNVKINVDGSIEAKAGRFGLWDIGTTGKLEAINKGVTTGYIRMADEDRDSLYSEVAIGSQYITLIDEDNRTELKSFDYKRIDIGLDDDIKFTSSYDGFASKYAAYGQEHMQISDFNTGNSVVITDDDINIGFTSPVKWKFVEDGPDEQYVNFAGARYIRFGNMVTVMMEVTSAFSNVTTRRFFAKLPKPIYSVGVQAFSKSDGKPISGAYYYLRESDGLLSNTGSMSTSVTHLLNFSYITNEPETRPFPPFL